LVDIIPLGSGSMDPDSGIQNIADPTDLDPDPKLCLTLSRIPIEGGGVALTV